MTFTDHFNLLVSLNLHHISTAEPISCFSRCQYVHETLMQKDDMGINKNNE